MERWGARRFAGAAVVLTAVAMLSAWSLAPLYHREPAVATGYALIDLGFTLTALVLAAQQGQWANARLTGILAASSLVSHLVERPVGVVAPGAYLFGSLTQVLAGSLILRYPQTVFDATARWWVRINVPTAGIFGVALLLTTRPEWVGVDPACWWPGPWVSRVASDQISFVRSVWRVVIAATFLYLVVRRWHGMARIERRTLAPIIGAAVFGATIIAADLLQWWLPAPIDQGLVTARSYSGAVLALAFVASAVELNLARSAVTSLATALSGPATTAAVRDALRSALGDDGLDVLYWVSETGGYVDHTGITRDPPTASTTERLVVPVADHAGDPLALVITDPSLARHQDLVASAVVVSGLALENARLHAGLRAQLAEVTNARSRLLQSAFAQRRQLERDLHDGAQQRLLALGMRLAALESAADEGSREPIRAAKAELRQAMSELRDLAHGIYPVTLTQGGLSVALDAVAERLPLVTELHICERRWPPDVEGVTYLVACEALTNAVKHGHATRAKVTIARAGSELRLVVSDDGTGWRSGDRPDLPDLADRLAALGGRLVVTSGSTGTSIRASIPVPSEHAPTGKG